MTYKAVKGDQVDELMAKHLRDNNCTINVVRTAPGKYMFGTKSIMAKVINGKLVIRVGGGYMGADEFIQQYGPMEMVKATDPTGQGNLTPTNATSDSGRQSPLLTGRRSTMVVSEMRAKMKMNSSIHTALADGLNDQFGVKGKTNKHNQEDFDAKTGALNRNKTYNKGKGGLADILAGSKLDDMFNTPQGSDAGSSKTPRPRPSGARDLSQ